MSAVQTDVNPRDVGTEALGCQRFCRIRAVLGLSNEKTETCSLENWDDESGKLDELQVQLVLSRHVDPSTACGRVELFSFSQLIEGRLES